MRIPMATRNRNYAAERARRDQLARGQGWDSYGQKRYAQEKFKHATHDVKSRWSRFLMSDKGLNASKQEQQTAFRAFWQGIVDKRTRGDTSRNSPKAEWFIEWQEIDMDYDEWEERYASHK